MEEMDLHAVTSEEPSASTSTTLAAQRNTSNRGSGLVERDATTRGAAEVGCT